MKTVLVVGGAGYIGSHVVRDLADNGYGVIVFDNLSEGHSEAVKECELVQADTNDGAALDSVFEKNHIDTVFHFSAFAYVGESMHNPEKYYKNNVSATINLLSAMLRHDVKKFIFSSSCATYGNPVYVPIDEKHPQNPINPYGATKLMVERILVDYAHAYNFRYATLRYFNAAGAWPDGSMGESHRIETHLIPLVLKTLTGEKEKIQIFGTDYDTHDGTCIRDYIHVCDLATAHRCAMEYIDGSKESLCVNLGTGKGVSVKEIIAACENITGLKVPVVFAPRRPGDPSILIAENKLAHKKLNFTPKYTDIQELIRTAWIWERNRRY
jgi:UDP-glucose 4-epimerase